jgi:chemotaxis protein MotB
MAAAASNQRPVVIKKVKKVSGGGHHGGAWKVAYADFVTAMMAFFLLMWLINTTTPEQKRGIADYFAPASVSQTTSGSGGMLAGTALSDDGVRKASGAPLSTKLSPEDSKDPSHPDQTKAASDAAAQQAAETAKTAREDAEFEQAEVSIRQAMQSLPDITELSKQVLIEKTPEGLRIQIIDQEGRSMFKPGEAEPNERAQRLLAAISKPIAALPNRLSISGHTDGTPPRNGGSNWSLSAARADGARRVLQASGIPQDRIYQVSGKADSEPLFPDDPTLPGNRRISITLLREAPVLPPGHSL